MLVLDEHDREREVWLSTSARAESALLSPDEDHDERQAMLTHDTDGFQALGADETGWQEAEEGQDPGTDGLASRVALDARDPETDNILAQYFGEVRRYALLSFPEEQALGRRIQRWRRRARWALYTAPTALPTLRRLWHQVEHQEIAMHEVVQPRDDVTLSPTAQQEQFRQTILRLQELSTHLGHPEAHGGSVLRPEASVQGLLQARVCLWRAWLKACEALPFHAHVHTALGEALEAAWRAQPRDPALGAAYRAWTQAQRELDQAKGQMMQANLRLVIHIATRFRERGMPLSDLIQEGNLGLMRAVDKFEPRRGLRFVTYAHWWIRQAISRAIGEQHRTIRLPSHIIERKSKLHAAATRLWESQGRAPSPQELSAALGWPPEEVEALLLAIQPLLQLQQPITEDGDALQDVLEDTEAPRPDTLVAEEQMRRGVEDCLVHLTEREAFIVRLRYGLGPHEPHSLQEVGTLLGISRERVRQLEKQAFSKIRRLRQSAVLAELVQ